MYIYIYIYIYIYMYIYIVYVHTHTHTYIYMNYVASGNVITSEHRSPESDVAFLNCR